ncbi:MAG: C-GCAxxG-C-C family protein [bacterium]
MDIQVENRASELFAAEYFCAESVLLAIAESRGIQSPFIPRMATGFCGGVARTGGTCGAVSGAILAINLVLGRDKPTESVEVNYAAVEALLDMFNAEFGSLSCPALIGCDLGTDAGQQFYEDNDLKPQCTQYVAEAARMAQSILVEY